MSGKKPTVLLECRRQAIKLRLLFWFLLIAGIFCVWGGWGIFQTYGLSPADGGVLKPFWQRAAFGGFLAGLGVVVGVGTWLYIGVYVLHLSRIGDRVKVVTMSPLGRREREFAVSEIGKSAYYHGRVDHAFSSRSASGFRVNAPWITLRVVGNRLPFILDLQAEVINTDALSKLAEGGVSDYQQNLG